MTLCECGCSQEVNPGRRFIQYHNLRDYKHSDTTKEKMRESKLGHSVSEKTRKKLHIFHTGRKISDATKEKMRKAKKGKKREKFTDEHKKRISKSHEGKILTDDHCRRMSAGMQGISYDEWEGFACNSLYCPAFNEECKESNRNKYGRRCFLCGKLEADENRKLSVHHVDMNKNQGCNGHEWKLVPLCHSHHATSHTKLWESRIEYLLKHVWV